MPYKGIRLLPHQNINAVYQMAASKANETYRGDFIDVEVQMLSKLCKAVKQGVIFTALTTKKGTNN